MKPPIIISMRIRIVIEFFLKGSKCSKFRNFINRLDYLELNLYLRAVEIY